MLMNVPVLSIELQTRPGSVLVLRSLCILAPLQRHILRASPTPDTTSAPLH